MEPTQNTPQEETTVSQTTLHSKKGGHGATIAITAVVVAGVLLAGYAYLSNKTGEKNPLTLLSSLGTAGIGNDAVARVNGTAIPRSEYEESLANTRATLEAQGADLTNPELQAQMSQQIVNSLIDTELLVQAAKSGDFTADTAAVENEYNALATQLGGIEALTSQMAAVGLTDVELKKDIEKQLTVRAYLQANISPESVTVSEEEIVAFYDTVAASQEGLPPLDEVRSQITEQLQLQKEQEAITKHLETLRASAQIEVLI